MKLQSFELKEKNPEAVRKDRWLTEGLVLGCLQTSHLQQPEDKGMMFQNIEGNGQLRITYKLNSFKSESKIKIIPDMHMLIINRPLWKKMLKDMLL